MINVIFISTAAILEALVLWWDVTADFKTWKKRKNINHSNQGFKRILLLIPSTVLYTIPIYWEGGEWWITALIILLCAGISFAMIGFRYWILFDGIFSNKRRFNFWHLGSDGSEDGRLDNFLQSLTRAQHIAVKVGGAVLFLSLYIIFLLW